MNKFPNQVSQVENSLSLTPSETANILKVHINTIYFWIKVGLLKGYRIGRVIRLKKTRGIVLDIFEN